MALSPAQRRLRIDQYARGPAHLKAALIRLPDRAVQWRPGAGRWSAHEVVCHCADAETNGAARLRYLLAAEAPVIVAFDQDEWARRLDYHAHPLEPALVTIEAVRANTTPLLQRLPPDAWTREGRHTESGRYSLDDWLVIYSDHLDGHARQIEHNFEAWQDTTGYL
jgi:DinB family protein